MQVQEINKDYKEPEPLNIEKLQKELKNPKVRRIFVFPAYGEDGKPTSELRRAWRRYNRTRKK